MRYFVSLALLGALSACAKSNPYPADAKTTPEKPLEQNAQRQKTYTLEAPFSVTCTQGIRCDFRVDFSVTNDSPVLTFENLPADVQVDERNGTVSWMPSAPDFDGQTKVVLVNLRGANDFEVQRQIAVALVCRAHTP